MKEVVWIYGCCHVWFCIRPSSLKFAAAFHIEDMNSSSKHHTWPPSIPLKVERLSSWWTSASESAHAPLLGEKEKQKSFIHVQKLKFAMHSIEKKTDYICCRIFFSLWRKGLCKSFTNDQQKTDKDFHLKLLFVKHVAAMGTLTWAVLTDVRKPHGLAALHF